MGNTDALLTPWKRLKRRKRAMSHPSLEIELPSQFPSRPPASGGIRGHVVRVLMTAVTLGALTACTGVANPTPAIPHPDAGGASQSPPNTWAAYLESLARSLQIDDPPVVSAVRDVEPEARNDQIIVCLATQGFPTNSEGVREFPNDQLTVFNLALYTCEAQYPIAEKYLQPLSKDQIRKVHSYLVNSAVPCLAALGYEVRQPPSLETFVDTFDTPGVSYVLSGELINMGVTDQELEAAIKKCPEFPPTADLYT